MLTTPVEALSPYSTAPVPRRISMRSIDESGIADHCTPDRSMSFSRRPSSRISVFWGPVAPNPRRSMEVLEALLPNRSFIVNPTCERSEEHTSELQSRFDLVCRLLLEKKKI